jgi:hypothetical protein
MKKWLEYLVFELIYNRKCRGLGPWLDRPRLLWLTVNKGARGGGHSGARELASGGTIERWEHGDPSSALTGAQSAVERWCDGGDE